jgi:hypothetical protein
LRTNADRTGLELWEEAYVLTIITIYDFNSKAGEEKPMEKQSRPMKKTVD